MKAFFNLILIYYYSFVFAQSWQQLDSISTELKMTYPDSAIMLGKKAVELCIKEKSLNSFECALCLFNLSLAYEVKNELNTEDSLITLAINITQKVNKTRSFEYADMLSTLGLVYMEKSQYKKSEKMLLEAKKICEDIDKGSIMSANASNSLALFYQGQGMYSEAEVCYKEMNKIYDAKYTKTSPEYAVLLNNIAVLYRHQGRLEEACNLLKSVKDIRKNVFGSTHPLYLLSCLNLGTVLSIMKRYTEADSLLKEVKTIIENQNNVQNKPYLASVCNNLGNLYMHTRNFTEAEKNLLQALDVVRQLYGENSDRYVLTLTNLARCYIGIKKTDIAEKYLKEAHTIASAFGENNPSYVVVMQALADLYMTQNNYKETYNIFDNIISIKLKDIQNNFIGLSEVEKELYVQQNLENISDLFHSFVAYNYLRDKSITQLSYNFILATKGIILNSSEKIKQYVLNSEEQSIKKLYLEWKQTKDKFIKYQNMSIQERNNKKINLDSIQKLVNNYEKELSFRSKDFIKLTDKKLITWKDIQDILKKDQAAIEIIRVNTQNYWMKNKDSIVYVALIVKKNTEYPEIVVLNNGNDLENSYITNYRRSVYAKIPDELSYNAFWKPIAEKLKGIKTVYFSPDGIYHQINLGTLQNPETKKYVSDETQVINLTNTKDILNKHTYTTKNNYLIGNPKFDIGLEKEQNNEKPKQERTFEAFFEGVSQLEGAEKEVKQISAVLPDARTTVGAEATEEYVKSIKNPRILHIATHGYFKKGQYQSSTQAMLNAGLLFSGVVDYDRMDIRPLDKEDGKLTAFEVMNMELDSTELVVLSACETGLGQASKEGVYGLQRAFKVAGAQSIIMSLWKVNDEATQLLMTKFYENWQKKGMDKRKAFETAQKELRKQYKEPYYWGAFVMIE